MIDARTNRRGFLKFASATIGCVAASAHAAPPHSHEVPWLTEVQQPPGNPELRDTGYLEPLLVADDGAPVTTIAQWEQRRASIRERWTAFLGPMPERPPVQLAVLSDERADKVRRVLVRYECEPGQFVEGYAIYPDPIGQDKRAGIVALHSTTPETIDEVAGVQGRDSRAIGLRLAQQGFVVFCPRCFLWQDASIDYDEAVRRFQQRNPGALGMRKMLNDAQAAVDVLASLPEVDATRIGAAGHSLGAKETLYLAAFDERIKASVASEGGIGLSFTNWHDVWYLGRGIQAPEFKLNHHQLLALIAPRAFLVLAGESGSPTMSVADGDRTWPLINSVLPVYGLYGDLPRIGLYNHRQGHTIPPVASERMTEWLQTYL